MNRLYLLSAVFFLCYGCHEPHDVRTIHDIEKNTCAAVTTMGYQIADQESLVFLLQDTGCIVDSHLCHKALSFRCNKMMGITECRPIANRMARRCVVFASSEPAFARQVAYFHKISDRNYPHPHPRVTDIGFKITFWDDNIDRPLYPFVAQVRFVDGKILYYYADPKTQALQEPPIVEAFDDTQATQDSTS